MGNGSGTCHKKKAKTATRKTIPNTPRLHVSIRWKMGVTRILKPSQDQKKTERKTQSMKFQS
ncbi:hypothetical protein LEP1GSC123_0683, partial [Leptospira borgpetersenii str. 200701203]